MSYSTSPDSRFMEVFKKIAGEDMEVDAWELREILNVNMKKELQGDQFSIESCKSMIALGDRERNGKLGIDEFFDLWGDLVKWRNVFNQFDADRSGSFDIRELYNAMRGVGFEMKPQVTRAIALRYCDRDQTISFDSFISCAVKYKFLYENFFAHSRGNMALLSLDQFLMINIYS